MHKGYTLNYFINFFQSIPDHRWTAGKLHDEGTVRYCALGHAGRNQNACLTRGTSEAGNARTDALESFLNHETAAINDGESQYLELGSTPRGRILRALRNRKRTGNVLGERN